VWALTDSELLVANVLQGLSEVDQQSSAGHGERAALPKVVMAVRPIRLT